MSRSDFFAAGGLLDGTRIMMNTNKTDHPSGLGLAALLLWALMALGLPMTAAAEDENGETEALEYTRNGADTCLKCHDETSEFPVLAIFKSPHGRAADSRTPFGGLQCEACHGPGDAHAGRVRRGRERPAMPYFAPGSTATTAEHNAVCLDCHRQAAGVAWPGSSHETGDTACSDCHKVHVRKDPALQTATQTEVCLTCHQDLRADLFKPSSHPIRQGEMSCTSCHSPHGSAGEHLLARVDLNQTCFDCHAEKRGPHLWEHAPAAEDCSLCHNPHGSNHPAMLTRRSPLLCQSCHARAGHPSVALTPSGLAGGTANASLLARGCVNCHTQVHGSNHPSGANLTR